MDLLVQLAQGFIGIFKAGADWWWAVFVGIVPLVVVLMTAFNAVIAWIGTERIEGFGKFASQEGVLFLFPVLLSEPFICRAGQSLNLARLIAPA